MMTNECFPSQVNGCFKMLSSHLLHLTIEKLKLCVGNGGRLICIRVTGEGDLSHGECCHGRYHDSEINSLIVGAWRSLRSRLTVFPHSWIQRMMD